MEDILHLKKNVIDLCINKSKTFIYTSALPSIFIKHALKRIDYNRKYKQKKLLKNVKQISKGLNNLGYEINSKTHIIPIVIGDEKKAMKFGKALMKNKIFAQPIRYPTVPKNQARIRLSVTAWLSRTQIDHALEIFERVGKKFEIL